MTAPDPLARIALIPILSGVGLVGCAMLTHPASLPEQSISSRVHELPVRRPGVSAMVSVVFATFSRLSENNWGSRRIPAE